MDVAPPPPPAKSSSKPVKKWKTVETSNVTQHEWKLDKNWQFSPETRNAVNIDEEIDWKSSVGIRHSGSLEETSEGVFFIDISTQGLVIVKGSSTLATDIFANKLGSLLQISIPKFKVVTFLDSEKWEPMVSSLWKIEAASALTGIGSKLSKCLMRPFLVVHEYIHGVDIEKLTPEQSKMIFSNDKVLKQLGSILTFDLLLNNWDRYPCIWKNDGNPRNIMFHINKLEAFGIDNSTYSIDKNLAKENYDAYLASVEDFITEIHSKDSNHVFVNKVRNFIRKITLFDIGEEGNFQVINGACETAKRIAKLSENEIISIKSEIEMILQPTLQIVGLDLTTVGFHRIDTSFTFDIVSIFKKVFA